CLLCGSVNETTNSAHYPFLSVSASDVRNTLYGGSATVEGPQLYSATWEDTIAAMQFELVSSIADPFQRQRLLNAMMITGAGYFNRDPEYFYGPTGDRFRVGRYGSDTEIESEFEPPLPTVRTLP